MFVEVRFQANPTLECRINTLKITETPVDRPLRRNIRCWES